MIGSPCLSQKATSLSKNARRAGITSIGLAGVAGPTWNKSERLKIKYNMKLEGEIYNGVICLEEIVEMELLVRLKLL